MFELRPFQKEALQALSTPGHVLCVAPTGSGKSLIYERAAARVGRRTLLVTPLVALARQQHGRLAMAGIAVALGAGPRAAGPPGGPGVWIISPEKLAASGGRAALDRWRPDFLVVDECHCLWEWGEDFRPAFGAIPRLLTELRIRSSLWLTATLPPGARTELRARIGPMRELGGFDLPPRLDLRILRVPWAERAQTAAGWVAQQEAAGIVFVPTREGAMRAMRLLAATGRRAIAYHAGMSSEERRVIEARLSTGEVDTVVATSAFGMGMDCPQLQWVLLWQAPASLLGFAQAIGRAGRDPNRPGRAIALWDDEDFRLLEWSIRGSGRRLAQLGEVRALFKGEVCRRAALREYFGATEADTACGRCDSCEQSEHYPKQVTTR